MLRSFARATGIFGGLAAAFFVSSPLRADESSASTSATTLDAVTVTGARMRAPTDPAAVQTATALERERYANGPNQSIAEALQLVPGVTVINGNGPRDVSISIRGSNNRQSFGVRNIRVYEDGFPVTQPDGLARTDLTDPHAYGAIEVLQGPSSAAFGNYATGGVIDFRLREGRSIDGGEVAVDGGGNQYLNLYGVAGGASGPLEYTAFFSDVHGQSDTGHTGYLATTANLLASYTLGVRDRLVVKFIDNHTAADLSIRLSLNQYGVNPYQQGCAAAQAAGCATVSLLANGRDGARRNVSAEAADLKRDDRRTITGLRWEHDFDAATTLRTQALFDVRDIFQPTSATAAIGNFQSWHLDSALTRSTHLLGTPLALRGVVWFESENIDSDTKNLAPGGGPNIGALTQTVDGTHANLGISLRGEWQPLRDLTASLGVAGEHTRLAATSRAYAYPTATTQTLTQVGAQRHYDNWAPELGLRYAVDEAWTLRGRFAGGYGTPQATNLFITAQGVAGNNSTLKTQRNLGVDLGADWRWRDRVRAGVTGFYEFFRNELVTQSAGANLQSFTFNAPRSEHRGVEADVDVHPLPAALPGLHASAAYLYDDQRYREYSERLTTGAQSQVFVRDDKRIPGVQPQTLNARLLYDQPGGRFAGAGAYLEAQYRESFLLDNANLIKAPGATLWNLNFHYTPIPAGPGPLGWRRIGGYLAVQNLFDETYVASASNITDTLNAGTGAQNGADVLANSTGSIYAGTRRLFVAGLNVRF